MQHDSQANVASERVQPDTVERTCRHCDTAIWQRYSVYVDRNGSTGCSQVPGGPIEPYIRARLGARWSMGMHWPDRS